jgi:hypothetical protein
MLLLANVIWGARCGESARRVLPGETNSSGHAHSVRGARESAALRQAPHGLPPSRLVSTTPLDSWMRREMRSVLFCRYADDGVIHCKSEVQARLVLRKLGGRLCECRLELHPEKTRIVYCQDVNRRAVHPTIHFTFLGYTFRPRKAVDKYGRVYVNFSPGVSREALKTIATNGAGMAPSAEVRQGAE